MTVRKDSFPFAPLDIEDEKRVVSMCGGTPTSMDGFRSFLAACGFEGIPLQWYREYISALGADCLEALSVIAPSAQRNLNRSMLLYAGVASVVVDNKPQSRHAIPAISPLPLHRETLQVVNDTNRTNLAITALHQANEIPSYERLLDRFGELFAVEDGMIGLQAARLGAGLLHFITMGSENAIEAELREPLIAEPEALMFANLEYDDSLAGLGDIFNQANWPD